MSAQDVTSEERALPGFIRDCQGRIENRLENVLRALSAPAAVGCEIAHDEFHGELAIRDPGEEWRPVTHADSVELRIRLARLGFVKRIVGKDLVRDALTAIGEARRVDSAQEWLRGLQAWDGVPRVARFCPDYLATEDTAYTRAVGLYAWTAHAGRVLNPGCEADRFPVLVGREGTGKTSAVEAIDPARKVFGVFSPSMPNAELCRRMRGVLVGEVPVLHGLGTPNRSRILEWVTRSSDVWRPRYQERLARNPRRSLLWGTTTDEDFPQVPSGEWRVLPLKVQGRVAVETIQRDRLQLWAEARRLFIRGGVQWPR